MVTRTRRWAWLGGVAALSACSPTPEGAGAQDTSAEESGSTSARAGSFSGTSGSVAVGGAGAAGASGSGSSVPAGGAAGTFGAAGAAGATGGSGRGGDGAGGAAGTTGGGGARASANCPATAQLCLDFEDGVFDGWTKKESGGTIAIDAAFASHGTRSLAIHAPGGQRGGHLEAKGAPLFPLPAGKLWGRIMVYVDGVPDGHTNFASGTGTGGGAYNVSEQRGSFMMSYYAGSAATDCWARPKNGVKVPNKAWACWEWSFDSKNNQLQYWLDGASLVTVNGTGDGCLSGNGVWKAPEFQALQIGEEIQQPGGADSKVWIDDVAISNVERVGCPTK